MFYCRPSRRRSLLESAQCYGVKLFSPKAVQRILTYGRLLNFLVKLCMTGSQVDRFAIDEHVFDVRAKLERIPIRDDQIRHLACLNTSKQAFNTPDLSRVDRNRLESLFLWQSKCCSRSSFIRQIADVGGIVRLKRKANSRLEQFAGKCVVAVVAFVFACLELP